MKNCRKTHSAMIQKIASASQSSSAYWLRSAPLGDLVLEGMGDLVRRDLLVHFNRRHALTPQAGARDLRTASGRAPPRTNSAAGTARKTPSRYFTAWMRSQSALR